MCTNSNKIKKGLRGRRKVGEGAGVESDAYERERVSPRSVSVARTKWENGRWEGLAGLGPEPPEWEPEDRAEREARPSSEGNLWNANGLGS